MTIIDNYDKPERIVKNAQVKLEELLFERTPAIEQWVKLGVQLALLSNDALQRLTSKATVVRDRLERTCSAHEANLLLELTIQHS